MTVEFTRTFLKDIQKLTQNSIKSDIADIIVEVEKAALITEIRNVKKLKGHRTAFRLKTGDYRIGFYFENGIIEFVRLAHRKDIYRIFP